MKYVLYLLLCWLVFTVYAVMSAANKVKRFNKYQEVKLGMAKDEVFKLMGEPVRVLPDPDYLRCEWELTSKTIKGVNNVVIAFKEEKVAALNATRKNY